MAFEACPDANSGCPHWSKPTKPPLRKTQEHGCFSDSDHKIPQRFARRTGATAIEIAIIHSDENKEQLCRNQHELKTLEENDEELLETLRTKVQEAIDGSP